MSDPNAEYDPERYWGQVGSHISERAAPSVLAGDDEPFDQLKRRKFVERMLGKLPIAGKSCLEVGCGPGGNLVELQRLGPARLAGVDISQTMVDLAARPPMAMSRSRRSTGAFCPSRTRSSTWSSPRRC